MPFWDTPAHEPVTDEGWLTPLLEIAPFPVELIPLSLPAPLTPLTPVTLM